MLNTFKHYAKLLCLVFAISLFTVSCEKEEVIVTEEPTLENTLKFISLNDLKSKVGESEDFSNLSKLFDVNQKNKTSKSNLTGLVSAQILTDEIAVAEKDEVSIYTFQLKAESTNNEFYNLLVDIDNGGNIVSTKILMYTPSLEWQQDSSLPFSGRVKTVENSSISLEDIAGIFSSNLSEPCIIDVDGHWECNKGNEHTEGDPACTAGTSWEYVIVVTWGQCPSDGNTGAGGGSGSGSSGFPVGTGTSTGGGLGNSPGGGTTTTGGGTNTGGDTTTTSPLPPSVIVPSTIALANDINISNGSTAYSWLATNVNARIAIKEFLKDNNESSQSKLTANKIVKILSGEDDTTILSNIFESKGFMAVAGELISKMNVFNLGGYREAWTNIDPDGVLSFTDNDWTIITATGLSIYLDFAINPFSTSKDVAEKTLFIEFLPNLKSLVGDHWPQNRGEWESVLTIMEQSMLEIGLAFVPGSGAIDAVSSISEGNYGMAAFALATVVADFFGGTIIKAIAKLGKVLYKSFKIFRLAYNFIKPLDQLLNKAYDITLNLVDKLKLTKNKKTIAQGDDTGRVVKNIADAINDRQRNVINQHKNTIGNATNKRKGNFGEMASDLDLAEKGYIPLHKRIDNIDAAGHNGIDAVMEKNGQYFIVESKFSKTTTPSLNPATSTLPKQMSDAWIRRPGELANTIGNSNLADDILDAGYTRVLATHGPNGNKIYKLVNPNGSIGTTWIP